MKRQFRYLKRGYEIELTSGPNGFTARFQGGTHQFHVRQNRDGELSVERDGRSDVLHVAADRDVVWVAFRGRTYRLEKDAQRPKRGGRGEGDVEGVLRAPMPGQVLEVRVTPGAEVRQGETLLVLEAMKMEIRIQAGQEGAVTRVPVSAGDQVDRDQVLVEIAPIERDED